MSQKIDTLCIFKSYSCGRLDVWQPFDWWLLQVPGNQKRNRLVTFQSFPSATHDAIFSFSIKGGLGKRINCGSLVDFRESENKLRGVLLHPEALECWLPVEILGDRMDSCA